MNLSPEKPRDLLENADRYHEAYYRAESFGGPSLYFHQRSLDTRQSPASLSHLEYVYATLSSWGMHRMGTGGSKMRPFSEFRASVQPMQDKIARAQQFAPAAIDDAAWALLKEIFQGIKIMASGTSLVGNSKVMHHMLPNIVPPIDRESAALFVRQHKHRQRPRQGMADDEGHHWWVLHRRRDRCGVCREGGTMDL